jgi:hypothetical protein
MIRMPIITLCSKAAKPGARENVGLLFLPAQPAPSSETPSTGFLCFSLFLRLCVCVCVCVCVCARFEALKLQQNKEKSVLLWN